MLLNIAVIASLAKAFRRLTDNRNCNSCYADSLGTLPCPRPLGEKLPTVRLCGILFVFYLIGMACALGAAPKELEHDAPYKDAVKPHAGGAFLIMGCMGSIALAGLSYGALGESGEEDAKANMESAPGAAVATADVEAPAAAPPPPPAEAPAAEEGAVAPAAPTGDAPSADPAERPEQLEDLRDKGLLSNEEYGAIRHRPHPSP